MSVGGQNSQGNAYAGAANMMKGGQGMAGRPFGRIDAFTGSTNPPMTPAVMQTQEQMRRGGGRGGLGAPVSQPPVTTPATTATTPAITTTTAAAPVATTAETSPAVTSTAGGVTQPNAYSAAAEALANATGVTTDAINMYRNMPTIASGMSTYQNPFTQDVIDRSMADLGRTTAMQQDANRAAAARAGAFGGSRHGLVEAETNAAAQRNMGDLAANLRMQGFNTAANLSGQDIANRFNAASGMMGGAGTLGNLGTTGFNMANTINEQQFNRGLLEQQMRQQQLNAARDQFYGFANAPRNYVDLLSSVLGGSPLNNSRNTSSTYQPGLLDFASLGLGIAAL